MSKKDLESKECDHDFKDTEKGKFCFRCGDLKEPKEEKVGTCFICKELIGLGETYGVIHPSCIALYTKNTEVENIETTTGRNFTSLVWKMPK